MLPTGVHVIRKTENANKFIAEVMEFPLVTERLLFPIPGPSGVKLLRKFHLDFSHFRIFFFLLNYKENKNKTILPEGVSAQY